MELTRKIFYNKRNGQGSLTIPSQVLKKIQNELKTDKPLDKISIKFSVPKKY
jgi:hypothetical protein